MMVASRLPRRTEAWLRIGAAGTAVVLLAVSMSVGATVYRGELLPLFVGVLAQVSALPLALIRPGVAGPLSVAGAVIVMASAHAGTAPWPWSVTTMVTQALVLALLGYRARWPLGVAALVLAVAFSALIAPLVDPARDQQAVAIDVVAFASIGGTTLTAGIVAQQWQVIGSQLARERRLTDDERARRLVAEEKTRIARELHDVIAHSMSVVTVQATSASIRHPQSDAAVRREFDEIAATSRRALAEMRSLLGVLRDPDAPVPRTPQPRLSGIAELVHQSRSSGLSVRLLGTDALTDDGIDDAVGLAAYRIVQEAVSNVMRHAPGAEAEVRVRRGTDLDLVVSNGPAPDPVVDPADARAVPGMGSGLLGMRERAASVGGTLAFGPTGDGGYEVHVTLPLQPAEVAPARDAGR